MQKRTVSLSDIDLASQQSVHSFDGDAEASMGGGDTTQVRSISSKPGDFQRVRLLYRYERQTPSESFAGQPNNHLFFGLSRHDHSFHDTRYDNATSLQSWDDGNGDLISRFWRSDSAHTSIRLKTLEEKVERWASILRQT